jgi:hypothetical protein
MADPSIMDTPNQASGRIDRSIHQETLERLAEAVERRSLPPIGRRAFILMMAANTFSTGPTQPLPRCVER